MGEIVGQKRALFAGVVLLCVAPPCAQAQNFNQLIGLGDSLTDTGWFTGATSGPHSTGFPPSDTAIAAARAAGGNGAWTGPGPGNAQILAGFFGLTANPVGSPGGTNYAIGGAVADLVPVGYGGTATGNLNPNPLLPGTVAQISNYLSSVNGRANPNALYILDGGGNDAFAAFMVFGTNAAAANSYFAGEAAALTKSVVTLQAAGARYIISPNYYAGAPLENSTEAGYINTIVAMTWQDYAAAGVKFIPADTASVIAAVEKNPAAFGITAPLTSPACVPPASLVGSGIPYGSSCAPTTTPNPNYAYLVSADATQTHLFADGLHLAEAGQIIQADYYYNLIVAPSEISFLAETAVQTTFQTIIGIQQQIDLAQRLRPPGWAVWANGQLSYLQLNNSSAAFPNDPGFPISGAIGVDYKWPNGWLAGAAITAGYVNSTFSLGGGYTQNVGSLSLYAAYRKADWWGDLIGTAGLLNDTTNRTVPIGITIQPNNGSTNGYDISFAGEIGRDVHTGPVTHGPVAGFILQQAWINGFTESGSFTSLSFASQTRNSEVSVLGYQARTDLGIWHPFAQIVWDHEFDALDRQVTASLTTIAAPSYSMPAVVLGRDWVTGTVGTQVTLTRAWSGLASFTAQFGQDRATVYGGLVGVNYAFGQSLPI